jgi:hypothetical protein
MPQTYHFLWIDDPQYSVQGIKMSDFITLFSPSLCYFFPYVKMMKYNEGTGKKNKIMNKCKNLFNYNHGDLVVMTTRSY